ncbi:hypothetical protein AURDEDRAFT_178724 [Auricularia subglabra TFB-10046 SS5]|uniref:Uncharacterized protein n=1 Tax=Auricularia subglabra (strain TFB-10046 / SS5) TaxID=717982 RepID=J0WIX3_AURST|nr:hypothetical protein AURDEDRAFT_178724 [Auricularia subglabra TFB-10046 SS5]
MLIPLRALALISWQHLRACLAGLLCYSPLDLLRARCPPQPPSPSRADHRETASLSWNPSGLAMWADVAKPLVAFFLPLSADSTPAPPPPSLQALNTIQFSSTTSLALKLALGGVQTRRQPRSESGIALLGCLEAAPHAVSSSEPREDTVAVALHDPLPPAVPRSTTPAANDDSSVATRVEEHSRLDTRGLHIHEDAGCAGKLARAILTRILPVYLATGSLAPSWH